MKIAILESLGISKEELDQRMKPFMDQGHTFYIYEKTNDFDTLKKETMGMDAVILANMPYPDEVILAGDQLKYIDVAFTGTDHIGLSAAKKKNIIVSNASGYSNEAVSELVIAMAIDLLRNIRKAEDLCRSLKTKEGLSFNELKGKTVGIIGIGKIGSRVAELFHAFGCHILAHSKTVHENVPDYVRQVSLEELLKESDIVSLHCPLNASTKNLIQKEQLALMKKTSILINCARGPIINANDLADALNNDRITAAAVDVFDREPPLDDSEPLLHAKNILVTPHMAFATKESMTLRAEIVFDNLKNWLNGTPVHVVSL